MDSNRDSFRSLLRLLALKRHELPPPGYFDHLRDRVRDRLELDESVEPEDWLATLLGRFRFQPALVGVFSFALGAFYLAGLGYSGRLLPRSEEAPWQVQRVGGFVRPLPPAGEPWTTAWSRDPRHSSIAPVTQTGLPGPVLPLHPPHPAVLVTPASYWGPPR